MVVFDLSHDRMSADPLADVLDVQVAFIFHDDRYAEAARKLGLSPAEVDELERRVIAGQLAKTVLPERLDAMTGMRHGHLYVLRSVRVHQGQGAFVLALANGKRVYVPMQCGNLSLLRSAPVVAHYRPPARRPARHVAAARLPAAVRAPAGSLPPAFAPAVVAPPVVAAIPAPPAALPAAAPVHHLTGFFIAGWIANAIGSLVGSTPPSLPACTAGLTSDAGGCLLH